jgi:hypothetical protein
MIRWRGSLCAVVSGDLDYTGTRMCGGTSTLMWMTSSLCGTSTQARASAMRCAEVLVLAGVRHASAPCKGAQWCHSLSHLELHALPVMGIRRLLYTALTVHQ